MRKLDVLKYYEGRPPSNRGAVRKIARALDISESSVHRWPDIVPPRAAAVLVKLSDGALEYRVEDYAEAQA